MRWLGWFRAKETDDARAAREWREEWARAVETPTQTDVAALRRHLEQLSVPQEELEIEYEMLDGLHELMDAVQKLETSGLVPMSTGHRAVGRDACYFTAPASLPDDPAHPFGTLLLTNTRLIFVGGAKAVSVPWHRVGSSERRDRDLLLVRADGQEVHRFRCNTYGDALRAAILARHLGGGRRV